MQLLDDLGVEPFFMEDQRHFIDPLDILAVITDSSFTLQKLAIFDLILRSRNRSVRHKSYRVEWPNPVKFFDAVLGGLSLEFAAAVMWGPESNARKARSRRPQSQAKCRIASNGKPSISPTVPPTSPMAMS